MHSVTWKLFRKLNLCCAYARPRYQVSVDRTIGPLVYIFSKAAMPIKAEFHVEPP